MEKLKRRYELELRLGADDLRSIIGALNSLTFDIGRIPEDTAWNIVSGGYDSGYTLDLKVDTAITHDSWYEHLEAYLADQKAEKEQATSED